MRGKTRKNITNTAKRISEVKHIVTVDASTDNRWGVYNERSK